MSYALLNERKTLREIAEQQQLCNVWPRLASVLQPLVGRDRAIKLAPATSRAE